MAAEAQALSRFRDVAEPVYVTGGPPVLVTSRFFAGLLSLPESSGAKAIWAAHPDQVLQVPAEEAGFDVDTPEDYSKSRCWPRALELP